MDWTFFPWEEYVFFWTDTWVDKKSKSRLSTGNDDGKCRKSIGKIFIGNFPDALLKEQVFPLNFFLVFSRIDFWSKIYQKNEEKESIYVLYRYL